MLSLHRSIYYYKPKIKNDSPIIKALNALAEKHPTYGFKKMFSMLRLQGCFWNHKRVYRVYKLLKLNLTKRTRKRLPTRVKTPLNVPSTPNQIWSMDFVSDALYNSRRFRCLTIIDDYNREIVDIDVNYSMPAYIVTALLQFQIEQRGKPQVIRVDNGPEFLSYTFIDFCNKNKIEINYIQPGKPTQNAFIERFNRSYRNEILNAYIFHSLEEVKEYTQAWIQHYNYKRPHDSLGKVPPVVYKNNIISQASILTCET